MKKLTAVIICFLFVGGGDVFAGPGQKDNWELGIEISSIKYEEPEVMRENGTMYGMYSSCTWYRKYLFRIEGGFSFGKVDYKNSGTMNGITDYMWEFRSLAGKDFFLSTASVITPYIGLGYRYLSDDMGGKVSSTGALGYKRESNYLYSPLGIETITELKDGWSIGVTIEYDYFWKGMQRSYIGEAIIGLNNLDNDQNGGYGMRGSIKLQKKGADIDQIIEPFIRYWNIEKSEEQDVTYTGIILGVGYEPKNTSTQFGVKFTARY
ncbi:MAG: hypothetical protein ABH952_04755 [Candidatus Omnitrophota bacterium]